VDGDYRKKVVIAKVVWVKGTGNPDVPRIPSKVKILKG